MIFEPGKYYRHTTGITAFVGGSLLTEMWGLTLVGEVNYPGMSTTLSTFGNDDMVNWIEITRDEYLKINYDDILSS